MKIYCPPNILVYWIDFPEVGINLNWSNHISIHPFPSFEYEHIFSKQLARVGSTVYSHKNELAYDARTITFQLVIWCSSYGGIWHFWVISSSLKISTVVFPDYSFLVKFVETSFSDISLNMCGPQGSILGCPPSLHVIPCLNYCMLIATYTIMTGSLILTINT